MKSQISDVKEEARVVSLRFPTERDMRKPKHGHCVEKGSSPTYRSWAVMIQRCTNPKVPKFAKYGARGILVCERWMKFDAFLSDMGERPNNLTIERINVHGNYEPSNCVWASAKTQANNKTNNRFLTYDGKTMTASQWADHLGISFTTLRMRLHRQWPLNEVLTPGRFLSNRWRNPLSPRKVVTGTNPMEHPDTR